MQIQLMRSGSNVQVTGLVMEIHPRPCCFHSRPLRVYTSLPLPLPLVLLSLSFGRYRPKLVSNCTQHRPDRVVANETVKRCRVWITAARANIRGGKNIDRRSITNFDRPSFVSRPSLGGEKDRCARSCCSKHPESEPLTENCLENSDRLDRILSIEY